MEPQRSGWEQKDTYWVALVFFGSWIPLTWIAATIYDALSCTPCQIVARLVYDGGSLLVSGVLTSLFILIRTWRKRVEGMYVVEIRARRVLTIVSIALVIVPVLFLLRHL